MISTSRRRTAAAALAVLALAAGCTRSGGTGGNGDPQSPKLRLVSALTPFSGCEELQDYLRSEGARLVGPYGLGGGRYGHGGPVPLAAQEAAGTARQVAASDTAGEAAAPQAGTDYSATNVQEAGVDEPDLVKTDGRRLVTFTQGELQLVDLSGDNPRRTATLGIGERHDSADLFLVGDRVLVLHAANMAGPGRPEPAVGTADSAVASPIGPGGPGGSARVRVTVVDISELAVPKVVSELQLDGSLVAARMVDGVARLVLRSHSPRLNFTYPSGTDDSVKKAEEANRKLVESSTVEDWLPTYSYAEPGHPAASASGRLGDCREVVRPSDFSGLGMVSVVTVDAADPRPGPAATVVGAADLVYASAQNLYVTSTRWPDVPTSSGPGRPSGSTTSAPPSTSEIHKFDISDKVRTRYVASGGVPGQLLNQFSMSEHEGDLRVATTIDGISRGQDEEGASESQLSVLRQKESQLAVVGSVGGLGKGERIYAVRFLGDRGYVVTFRQTDPLYVIDLADPERPAVRGELKIPGYSAYLHPVGEHRLVGVGQEATEQGRPVGTQVSLFDVSDPASPKRLAQAVLPQAHSEAEFDHHAFLYWPRTGLTLLPIQSYGAPVDEGGVGGVPAPRFHQQFVGAVGFSVRDGEVTEIGRVRHRNGVPIRRSLVVGDVVLTVSDGGLLASELQSLTDRSWLAF
ncbi:MAG: beta-propeller domain-containing protein [Actinobacteria bacterium]|nr:beta-propeller domain-containing protein [Actinomycetota bacterium]